MKIETKKQFIEALRKKSEQVRVYQIRANLNPHHPQEDKEYEKAATDLYCNEIEIAALEYLKINEGNLLVDDDPQIRKLLAFNKVALDKVGDYDDYIEKLKCERESLLRITERCNESRV